MRLSINELIDIKIPTFSSFILSIFPGYVILLQADNFETVMASAETDLPNAQVLAYIRDQWVPVKEKLCLLGRRFYHGDHDTNNLVERFVGLFFTKFLLAIIRVFFYQAVFESLILNFYPYT